MRVIDKVKGFPWVVMKIGAEYYCANTHYVSGIVDSPQQMIETSQNQFIKGVYTVLGVPMPVIDVRKLVDFEPIDTLKVQLSKEISSIRFKYEAWVNELTWCLATGDSFTKGLDANSNDLITYMKDHANDKTIPLKTHQLFDKMVEPNKIIYSLAKKIVDKINLGNLSSDNKEECEKLLKEIRRQTEKYILRVLDSIIELVVSSVEETIIVIKCNGKVFGLSVDRVETIAENTNEISRDAQTRLSSGVVTIKDKKYNILDLTKLSRLV